MARRLTVMMSADVVGYSRRIKADEAATLASLRALRDDMFTPLIEDGGGRIAKQMGDGWLVEFTSVTEAVRTAFDVQTRIAGESDLRLRIGLHLGDVVFGDNDIYGDGVNLAARLQEAAEAGTVMVSDLVLRSLDQRLAEQFRHLGKRSFKNIDSEVPVYQWSPPDAAPPRNTAFVKPKALMVGVLPFDNLSDDAAQEFFADGITEEIITTLSKLPHLLVVARNSTFVYKGRSVDVKQVGREQGVDYVLEGSVRTGGNQVRITAQLIDARTGMHVWADRYDRSLDDVFDVQDEIALRIATELQVELLDGEMARFHGPGTRNLEAWTAQLQAAAASQKITRESSAVARRNAERAIALDPGYSAPLCTLGFVCTVEARHGFGDRATALAEARRCAQRALDLEAYNPDAHAVNGFCNAIEGNLDDAIPLFRRALEQNPNHADVAARMSLTLAFAGQTDEAIKVARHAITLNPFYPGWYAGVLGFALRAAGRLDEAEGSFVSYSEMVEGFGHIDLAIIHALRDDTENARRAAAKVLHYRPQFTVSAWSRTQLYSDPARLERDMEALRAAGLPD